MLDYKLHNLFLLPDADLQDHSKLFFKACETIVKIDKIDEIYGLHGCLPNVSRSMASKSLLMRVKTCAFLLEFFHLGENYILKFLDEFASFFLIGFKQENLIFDVLDLLPTSPAVPPEQFESWVESQFCDIKIKNWALYLLIAYFVKSYNLKHHPTLMKFLKNFG